MSRLLAMMLAKNDPRRWNTEGGGAGGAPAGGQGGADGSQGQGGAGDGGNGQGTGGTGGAGTEGGQGGGDKPWYESRAWSDPTLQQHLVKSGYHKGTAEEALEKALKGEMTATSRLGKNPAQLLDAPTDGQPFTEWLKANGGRFGVPDAPDKYEVKLPGDLPKDLPIDEALLSDYRAFALQQGYPPALVQANVDFWAKSVSGKFSALATAAAQAEEALNGDLQKSWGGNWKQNQQLAIRAFQAIAADQKLTPEQTSLVAAKLNEGMGDATLLKFFHGLAVKLGEDTLAIPRGGNAPALQLAEAQQRKAAIMERHTGDMAQAMQRSDQRRVAALREELKGLNAIIGQHGGQD